MVYSIIKKSQVQVAHRFDAEYYQPKYLDAKQKLEAIKTTTIGEISKTVVNFGAYSLCNYITWQEKGVPYLNVENIKAGYIDFEGVKYIDAEINEILKKSKVKEGQVILTMAGTIGNAAVAHNIPEKLNSNQAMAKIALKKGFSPYYLAAFLNSYYGRRQTEREIVSSVQPNIFLWQIKNLRVPLVSENKQKMIEEIYRCALEAKECSGSLYSQAEELLIDELGLKDYKVADELTYASDLSNIRSAHRMDAEYYQPKYQKLISKLCDKNAKYLIEVVENVPARFNPATKPNERFRYIELANIDSSIGIIDGCSEVIGIEAPSRAGRLLKTDDVIVSSIEGSLKNTAIVDSEQDGCLASTGFFQFRCKYIMPRVLLILARSFVVQMQLEKQCAGTILTAVPKEAIKNILIPVPPKSVQQKISELVQKSHEARRKAKQLLEEAKQKVEKMISGE